MPTLGATSPRRSTTLMTTGYSALKWRALCSTVAFKACTSSPHSSVRAPLPGQQSQLRKAAPQSRFAGVDTTYSDMSFYAGLNLQAEKERMEACTDALKRKGLLCTEQELTSDILAEQLGTGRLWCIVLVDLRYMPYAGLFLSLQPSYMGHFVVAVRMLEHAALPRRSDALPTAAVRIRLQDGHHQHYGPFPKLQRWVIFSQRCLVRKGGYQAEFGDPAQACTR